MWWRGGCHVDGVCGLRLLLLPRHADADASPGPGLEWADSRQPTADSGDRQTVLSMSQVTGGTNVAYCISEPHVY